VEEAARYIGLGVSTLRAEVLAGRAPKAVKSLATAAPISRAIAALTHF
jgi:hypothetical protein